MTLVEMLSRHAAARGPHRAVVLESGEPAQAPVAVSFSDLEQRMRALAATLQAQGATGERVVVACPPGLDFIVGLGACFYAGAIAVPARLPQFRLVDRGTMPFASLLADARPRLVLTPVADLERVRWFGEKSGLRIPWLAAAAPVADAAAWRDPRVAPDQLALLQYTSGSTGAPRGVAITHANLASNIAFIARRYAIGEASVVVNWLPPHHDMGLIGHTVLPLMVGCTAVHMSPLAFLQQPKRWLAAISSHGGTHGGGPNFGYELCVRAIPPAERSDLDLSTWYAAHNGAEPVRAATLARFSYAFAPCGFDARAFAPCYGLAESTLMVTGAGSRNGEILQLPASRTALASGQLQPASTNADAVHLVGCGAPDAAAGVAIVDGVRRVRCAEREIGEIWISGPSTAAGYWRQDDSASFGARLPGSSASWHRTGDLGALMDGQLFVTGRLKDLIIIAGRNLYPQDLETSASNSHPALIPERAAAFSREGEWVEEVVLVCEVRRTQRAQLDADAVFSAIRAALLRDCEVSPATILLVREHALPVTGSGKIRRAECRNRHMANAWELLARSDAAPEAPTASTTAVAVVPTAGDGPATLRYLVASLADMLRRAPHWVQPQQTLSDLGLDSLGRVELTLKLEAELHVRLPPDELAMDPSVEALAQRLAGLSRKPDGTAVRTEDAVSTPIELPLLPLQREFLWDGVQQPGRFATVLILRSPAGTQESWLADALAHLEREFDALRLRFHRRGRSWQQLLGAAGSGVKFSRTDASSADAAARRTLRLQLQEQLVGDLDITHGPLLRAIWLDCGAASSGVLALAIHHLVSDGLSMVALLTACERNYRALAAGTGLPTPAPAVGFAEWNAQLQQRSTHPEILAQTDYWRQVCGSGLKKPAVAGPAVAMASTGVRQLDPEATARFLNRYPSAHQQHDALLAAFALAAAQVLGLEEFLVRLENHGRHAVLGLQPNLAAG
jgi:acyl-CoA synthetase (AMP-forming)/AMP-acid ligase II/acyl carrier protein